MDKKKELIGDFLLALVGLMIGALVVWFILDVSAHKADQVEPVCHNGIYSIIDGERYETVYVEENDTCKKKGI